MMNCPKCGKPLNPQMHQDMVCDGQVWCKQCHSYSDELLRFRQASEIMTWSRRICQAFGQKPVTIEVFPNMLYRDIGKVLVAQVYHHHRLLELYTPGLSLATLCHELAHIFTGEDHTPRWAQTFADLVAWVKTQLSPAT